MTHLISAPVTLVLGGGGGRALAHIGVWRALQERGISAQRVVGTSAGALIGACIAAGMSWQDLVDKARRLTTRPVFALDRRVLFRGVRSAGLLGDQSLRGLIRALVPVTRFEELAVPLSMNAVDLSTGDVVWFGEGGRTDVTLADAIYASCALPLFFPPASIAGRRFIDGGVVDPLPIERARALGAGTIVAVDLATDAQPSDRQSGMLDTYCRMVDLLRAARRSGEAERAAVADVDLVRIHPSLSAQNIFDLSRAAELISAGYDASVACFVGHHPAGDPAAAPPARKSRWLATWIRQRPASLRRLAAASR